MSAVQEAVAAYKNAILEREENSDLLRLSREQVSRLTDRDCDLRDAECVALERMRATLLAEWRAA